MLRKIVLETLFVLALITFVGALYPFSITTVGAQTIGARGNSDTSPRPPRIDELLAVLQLTSQQSTTVQNTIDTERVAMRALDEALGLGLIEAIPDGAIVQNMLVPKPDGVRGKVAEITDVVSGQKRVGRLGWKAQQATLLAFAADAYSNEMGITNRFFSKENAPNGNEALLARFKRTTDPEDTINPATGKSDIDMAADFMRFLAPPARLAATAQSTVDEPIFSRAGCATCHTPVLRTGPNPIAALDRKAVNL